MINLHDATLVSMVMQWGEGVVELALRTVDHGLVTLRAEGVTYLEARFESQHGVVQGSGSDERTTEYWAHAEVGGKNAPKPPWFPR